MARHEHRQGPVTRLAALGTALALSVTALAGCADTNSDAPEPTSAAPSAGPASGAAQDARPGIGEGDPMLGVTDGVQRPELRDIPTDQLDRTNVLETAERFRRTFEDEAVPTDAWAAELRTVADPTLAASIPGSARGYFTGGQSAELAVTNRYTLDSRQPYATVTALDEKKNPMWHMRLAIKRSDADPSIGTWSVISVDWDNPELAKDKTAPLTERERDSLRVTATFASAGVLTQKKGEAPENRAAFLQNYLSTPQNAAARGKPLPAEDVNTVANNPDSTYFVTPEGSANVWVEVNGSFSVANDDGTTGDKQPVTMFVELEPTPDGFVGRDVYTEEQFTAATQG